MDLALMEQLIQEAVDRLMDARMAGVMKALTLMEGGEEGWIAEARKRPVS